MIVRYRCCMGISRSGRWIAGVLLAAFAARLVSIFAVSFVLRPDEIFQNLEPAHRLVTGYGVVTWEWRAGLRSWLMPEFYAAIMRLSADLGLGHAANVVRCVLAALSLGLVGIAMAAGRKVAGPAGAALCAVAIAFWPDCILYGPRTLAEAQGGELLSAGVLLAGLWLRGSRGWAQAVAIGFLLALSVMVRLQYLPGAALAVLWCAAARPAAIPFLLAGALPALVLEGLVDWHASGVPFAPLWVNFHINYVQHRADVFGTQSILFYPFVLARGWGALTIPLVAGLVWGARSMRLELAAALAVVLTHSVIPHKEASFVFGAVPLLVVVAAAGIARQWQRIDRANMRLNAACGAMALACILALLSGYRVDRLENVPYLHAMHIAARTRDICGVGQFNPGFGDWMDSGGYTTLDRPIPLYFARTARELGAMAPGFDLLIAPDDTRPQLPSSYVPVSCWRKICVLRRTGGCRETAAPQISAELAAWGQ